MPTPQPAVILDEEKVGQKRPNKEELIKGHVTSSESETEEGMIKEQEQHTIKN